MGRNVSNAKRNQRGGGYILSLGCCCGWPLTCHGRGRVGINRSVFGFICCSRWTGLPTLPPYPHPQAMRWWQPAARCKRCVCASVCLLLSFLFTVKQTRPSLSPLTALQGQEKTKIALVCALSGSWQVTFGFKANAHTQQKIWQQNCLKCQNFTSIFTDYKRKNYKKKEKAATDQLYKSQNSGVVGALQPVAVSVCLSVCPFCWVFTSVRQVWHVRVTSYGNK